MEIPSSYKHSLVIHLLIFGFFVVLSQLNLKNNDVAPVFVDFKVVEKEIPLKDLKIIEHPTEHKNKPAINQQEQAQPKVKPVNEVFGLSRKALTSDDSANSISVKAGNTIAKENDEKVLHKDDPDSVPGDLPPLAEEYLVSEMPKVLTEFRATYPKAAKDKNIEGAVVLDIIIDDKGKVRWAKLISGPGFGLNEAALESIYQFLFKPARIENKSVSVKIRYAIRFVLEK